MSLHPSLRQAGGKGGAYRNVLKRYERLRHLMSRGLWTEGRSIFGLPKIKQEKVKVKKAAAKEAAAAEQPAGTTPETASPQAS